MLPIAVQTQGLSRRFDLHVALRDLSLTLPPASALLVVGPNGAGKTTLLRLLATSLRPSAGRALVFGHDLVRDADAVRQFTAYIGTAHGMYEGLTASENLAFASAMSGRPDQSAAVLERVGLSEVAHKSVRTFSHGMKRRLALARGWMLAPRLLLLDDPFSGLDAEGTLLVDALVAGGKSAGGAGRRVRRAGHARVGTRAASGRHDHRAGPRPAGGSGACRGGLRAPTARARRRPDMSAWRRTVALARKDLLLEWRGRETITAMAVLALLVVLLLGFALGAEPPRAPAILWVALALAAMLGVARPTQAEVEQQALETLLLYPGSREHLYWGKWAALTVLLSVLLALLLVTLGVLFNVDLWAKLPALFGVGVLGIAGLSAVGTLFAALVIHVRGRELLIPLHRVPVALPGGISIVRQAEAVHTGAPGGGLWFGMLAVFDILFLLVAPILYEVVMEEA